MAFLSDIARCNLFEKGHNALAALNVQAPTGSPLLTFGRMAHVAQPSNCAAIMTPKIVLPVNVLILA